MTAVYLPLVLRDGPALVAYELVAGTRDTLVWEWVMGPAEARWGIGRSEVQRYITERVRLEFRENRAEWCDRKVARLIRRGNAA